MKTKQPKSTSQQFVDRYFSVREAPTWHEGFKAALDMVAYEINVNGLIAESLSLTIKEATAKIEGIEAEE